MTNNNFKPDERELIRVATFFKKRSRQLIAAGKLSDDHRNVEEAVDRFVAHLDRHANTRAAVFSQHEELKKMVRDEALCPSCQSGEMLKYVGTEANEKGWKSNRYKCRRCNIAFTWNRPNNPWDMVSYFEEVLAALHMKCADVSITGDEQQELQAGIDQLNAHLERLKPVLESHDREYNEIISQEEEMEKLVHEFKNSLMIEKIKLETWSNNNPEQSA